MNFWLLKQLREYCRVNEGATALHENPAALIWKISTSVFINPHFFFLFHVLIFMNYIGYVHFQKVWFIWNWLQILTVKVWKTVRFHDIGNQGPGLGVFCLPFVSFKSHAPPPSLPPKHSRITPPPPSPTHPSLKGIWISLVPDCSHNKQ